MKNRYLLPIILTSVALLLSSCDDPTSSSSTGGNDFGAPAGGHVGSSLTLPSGPVAGWIESETAQVQASLYTLGEEVPFGPAVVVGPDGMMPEIELTAPSSSVLARLGNWIDEMNDGETWISASDENAQFAVVWGLEVFRDEEPLGEIYRETADWEYTIDWLYVDRDVTVNGSVTFSDDGFTEYEDYALDLRTGWNRIVYRWEESANSDTYTVRVGAEPNGVGWIYDPWD